TPNGIWYDTTYTPRLTVYQTDYGLWINPATSTKPVLDNLKDAEKALFPLYREFYATVKASPLVTNAYLEDMGFPPRPSGTHTPHPVDRLYVLLGVSPVGNLVVKVVFEDRDTGSSVIPYYLTGVVFFWHVGDVPVTNQRELDQSALASRSPHDLVFDPTERAKVLSIAGRWQNRRGELGPWSEIITVNIP
ncbi:MAG: hypothetical protein LBJ01_08585, partial [Tannerella sp.]|nr:hypothetical protein [Tannerella sp.]